MVRHHRIGGQYLHRTRPTTSSRGTAPNWRLSVLSSELSPNNQTDPWMSTRSTRLTSNRSRWRGSGANTISPGRGIRPLYAIRSTMMKSPGNNAGDMLAPCTSYRTNRDNVSQVNAPMAPRNKTGATRNSESPLLIVTKKASLADAIERDVAPLRRPEDLVDLLDGRQQRFAVGRILLGLVLRAELRGLPERI